MHDLIYEVIDKTGIGIFERDLQSTLTLKNYSQSGNDLGIELINLVKWEYV